MGDKSAAPSAQTDAGEAKRANWFRTQLDRVQTKWVGTIGLVLFLAATAAFGGLNAVADPGPPSVHTGDLVTTDSLEMIVQKVYLADRIEGGANIDSESEDRVLAVQIDIKNLAETPRIMRSTFEGLGETQIKGGPAKAPDVSRPSEPTGGSVTLQPGIKDTIILSWAVDPTAFPDGKEVRIALPDPQSYRGQFLDHDLHWTNEGVSAIVAATVEDIGEGDPW
ncbi:hypothetical protein ACFVAE_13875 [Microbacterium sp. NPDC057659]|uniref:hypothetical protein n=1 Tax=Microbacterium sp. NPDC057659 TaxID=3346198 RepID=UPI00366EBEAC